ncbi:MAG: oxidative damage protection protein [Alistipes senegalensis]|nr:oxidative damage protection protein [Oxalobacter formigenes]MCM1281442.1 oxidative damage protection protein [Alistipes senegalensis]
MTRMIYCAKLKKEGAGLDYPPYPGEMGKRIYDNISKEAWNAWVQRQTMLVNEYRLNMTDPQARRFLAGQMQAFLFEEEPEDGAGKGPSSL